MIVARLDEFLGTTGDAFARARSVHEKIVRAAHDRLKDLDGWLCPSRSITAPPGGGLRRPGGAPTPGGPHVPQHPTLQRLRHVRSTTPIQQLGDGGMPAGLQLICAGGDDRRLLSIGQTIEDILGPPPVADVTAFAAP